MTINTSAVAMDKSEVCKQPPLATEDSARRNNCCEICGRLPFRLPDNFLPLLAEENMGWDFEGGVYEFLYKMNQDDGNSVRLEPTVAKKTADRCARHTQRLKGDLVKSGVLPMDSGRERIIPPVQLKELRISQLLGVGGFSAVYDVIGFVPSSDFSETLEDHQRDSRRTLCELFEKEITIKKVKVAEDKEVVAKEGRFALKHLRRGLIKEPEKFERAAIDLVLEAQLLMSMDHPNIVSLRGMSSGGVEGLASGKNTDFFIIVDRLSETLDQQLFKWRNSHKKYKARAKLPWGKSKYFAKLDNLLLRRLQVIYDVATAVEYMHDRRIINRDLKTSNIGFDESGQVKLFDFGLSRLLPSRRNAVQNSYNMSRVGTKYYMAPEVRAKAPYNLSADVYSFGVVCWEILSLSTPRETIQKIKAQETKPAARCMLPVCGCWSIYLQRMVKQTLMNDPVLRPRIADIRVHLGQELGPSRKGGHGRVFSVDLSSVEAETSTLLSNTSHGSELRTSHDSYHDFDSLSSSLASSVKS